MATRRTRNVIEVVINAADRTERGLANASRRLEEFTKRTEAMSKRLRDAGKKLTIAGGAVTGALALTVRAAAQVGDELQKTSIRTGIAVETLSRLGFAAEQSGADMAAFRTGIRRMAKNAKDAADGLATAREAFDELGVRVTDARGELRPMYDIFLDIADAVSRMENKTRAAALAQEVLGRGGDLLLPLLVEGRAGVKALAHEADRLALTWNRTEADAAANIVDALNRVRRAHGAVQREILVALEPAIVSVSNKIAFEYLPRLTRLVEEHKGLVKAVGAAGVALTGAGGLLIGLGAMSFSLNQIAVTLRAVKVGLTALALTIATNPELLALAGIAAGAAALSAFGPKVGAPRPGAPRGAAAGLPPALAAVDRDIRALVAGLPGPADVLARQEAEKRRRAEEKARRETEKLAESIAALRAALAGEAPLGRAALLAAGPRTGATAVGAGPGEVPTREAVPGLLAELPGTPAAALAARREEIDEYFSWVEERGGVAWTSLLDGVLRLGDTIGNVFASAFERGKLTLRDFGETFKQVFAGIVRQIIAAIVKMAVFNFLLSAFGVGVPKLTFGKALFGLRSGGLVGLQGGGLAVVTGGPPGRDAVPAMLARGEAVLPAELVRRLTELPRAEEGALRPVVMPVQFFLGSESELVEVERRLSRVRDYMDTGVIY